MNYSFKSKSKTPVKISDIKSSNSEKLANQANPDKPYLFSKTTKPKLLSKRCDEEFKQIDVIIDREKVTNNFEANLNEIIKKNPTFQIMKGFSKVQTALNDFIIEKKARGYGDCTLSEKRLFQSILQKMLGCDQFQELFQKPEPDLTFNPESVEKVARQIRKASKIEAFNYLISEFIEYETKKIVQLLAYKIEISKKEKLNIKKIFLERIFKRQNATIEDNMEIIAAFVKLNPKDEDHIKLYGKNDINNYIKNYTLRNRLKLIKSQPLVLRSFQNFLNISNNEKTCEFLKSKIQNAIKNYLLSFADSALLKFKKLNKECLDFLSQKLSKSKKKTPMLFSDIEYFSQELSKTLGINDIDIK